jgi:hypothetical protein
LKLAALFGLLSLLIFASCNQEQIFEKSIVISDSNIKGQVKVEKVHKLNKYKISIHNSLTGGKDIIYTPYQVFELAEGDINRDGKTDFCIGIIKPTPFDKTYKKRLFIFQIDQDYIRPLWLSSRLANTLETFVVVEENDSVVVKTIEIKKENEYCIHQYKWGSFGMVYQKEIGEGFGLNQAKKILRSNE